MNKTIVAVSCTVITLAMISGCANTPEGESARRGAKYGAAGGAALGLALGALTGDAELAVKGAATGAVVGGASGAMYEYDNQREDNRTKMMADAIGGARKGETTDDAGKRHLEDFIGEWNINIWAMMPDGKRITATGQAKAVMDSKTTTTITYDNIRTEGYEDEVTGTMVFGYDPAKGFSLSNQMSVTGEELTFAGEYIPDGNKYNFFLTSGEGGKMATGTIRSSVRVEIRVSGPNMWVAEAFTFIDGKEIQVQSYRFTQR